MTRTYALMPRFWPAGLLLFGLLLGLPACCGNALEQDYGRSVSNNISAQIVNPEAGKVARVGVGQAPDAAANAYDKYSKSFKTEEKKQLLKLTTEN